MIDRGAVRRRLLARQLRLRLPQPRPAAGRRRARSASAAGRCSSATRRSRIKPRLDPALWAWLCRFARRCNRRDMLRAGQAIQALLNSVAVALRRAVRDGADRLRVAEARPALRLPHAAAMDHYAATDELLRDAVSPCPRGATTATTCVALEPALQPGLAGGWHYERDAHLRPDRLMASWRASLEARGVEIRENCELTGVRARGRRVPRRPHAAGRLPADAFVVATGAWTPLLTRHTRLPGADPARQGLLDHDAAARRRARASR